MTCNVFKGRADAQEIVDVVRSERVEVLALQETTDAFVDELNKAGIGDLLPYAQVASSDGVYGNGLWSASPLGAIRLMMMLIRARRSCQGPRLRSMMVRRSSFRFSAYHVSDRWVLAAVEAFVRWLQQLRYDTSRRYVFMGDFNATDDHTPFRNFLETELRMRSSRRLEDWCSRGLRISIMCRRLRALTISYWIPACWPVGSNR